jgi:hypothetical protein
MGDKVVDPTTDAGERMLGNRKAGISGFNFPRQVAVELRQEVRKRKRRQYLGIKIPRQIVLELLRAARCYGPLLEDADLWRRRIAT